MGRKTDKLASIINEKIDDEERAYAAAKITKLFSPDIQKTYKKVVKAYVGYKPEKYGYNEESESRGKRKPKTKNDNRVTEYVERPSTKRSGSKKIVDTDSDDGSEDESSVNREYEQRKVDKKAMAKTRSAPVKNEVQLDEKPSQSRPIPDTSNSQTKLKSWRDAL